MRAIVSASKGINAIKSSKFFVAVGDYYFKVFVISLTGKTVKKKTLAAWTKLLLNSGEIDIKKYNRMIMMIERLAA